MFLKQRLPQAVGPVEGEKVKKGEEYHRWLHCFGDNKKEREKK